MALAASRRSLVRAAAALCLAGGPFWVSAQGTANPPPAMPAAAPAPVAGPAVTTPSAEPAAAPAAATSTTVLKVALILPAQTTPFARAAETVRQGFFAAHEAGPQGVAVQVIEVDERPEQVLRAMKTARERGAQVLVGPLTRAQVNAALGMDAGVPVVTLSLPENDLLAPASLLAFGISVEQEARAVVRVVLAAHAPAGLAGALPASSLTPRFVLLTGEGPLSRRAALAYQAALKEAGERVTVIHVNERYDALQSVGDRVFRLEPEAVLLALDGRQAAMVRPRLPHQVPIYGTSLVNLGGAEAALLAADLDGVRFVDAPWLLEPDHPAVMAFKPPPQPLSAELARLYALGIDAYRLAMEWGAGRSAFTLDGVTGALAVDRAAGARVERRPSLGVFRQGKVERVPLAGAR